MSRQNWTSCIDENTVWKEFPEMKLNHFCNQQNMSWRNQQILVFECHVKTALKNTVYQTLVQYSKQDIKTHAPSERDGQNSDIIRQSWLSSLHLFPFFLSRTPVTDELFLRLSAKGDGGFAEGGVAVVAVIRGFPVLTGLTKPKRCWVSNRAAGLRHFVVLISPL